MKVTSIGNSVELRKLYKISIGDEALPKIVVDCGIHAREWAAHAWCYKLIDDLVNGGSKDMKRVVKRKIELYKKLKIFDPIDRIP